VLLRADDVQLVYFYWLKLGFGLCPLMPVYSRTFNYEETEEHFWG